MLHTQGEKGEPALFFTDDGSAMMAPTGPRGLKVVILVLEVFFLWNKDLIKIPLCLNGICLQGDAGLPGAAGIQVSITLNYLVRMDENSFSAPEQVWFPPFKGACGTCRTQRRIRFSRKTCKRHKRSEHFSSSELKSSSLTQQI